MDRLAVNFSTDHNKIYFQGKITLSRSLLKLLTLVQHFVNCDSLVLKTGVFDLSSLCSKLEELCCILSARCAFSPTALLLL